MRPRALIVLAHRLRIALSWWRSYVVERLAHVAELIRAPHKRTKLCTDAAGGDGVDAFARTLCGTVRGASTVPLYVAAVAPTPS